MTVDTTPSAPVDFNPFTPEFRADPWSHYRPLPAIFHLQLLDVTALTRHADVEWVLHDPRFSSDPRTSAMAPEGDFPANMLASDPPVHTRLRTLVNKAFTARRVEALRPRIAEITTELLDRVEERGEMDVIADLAYPVPITVIAELLGVPATDQDKFREWSYPLAASLDPIVSPELQQQTEAAGQALGEYLTAVADERRQHPTDDMISALVAATRDGDRLTADELVGMLVLLLVAGHETTVNLIGNGLYALLQHAGEARRLREDPSLARSAIEELLRYDGPVQLTGRHPLEDLELRGHALPKGRTVMTLLGAANRDPSVFDDPDSLRVDRAPNPHVTFGQGIHFCVGAPLARIEGQVAITETLRRFPRMGLDETPEYRETLVIRGLKSLRVTV